MASGKKVNKNSSSSSGKDTSSQSTKRKSSKKTSVAASISAVTRKFSELKFENVVKCLYNYQLGSLKPSEQGRLSEQVITEKLRRFYVYERENLVDFDRRITALQFHPKDPQLLAIGSKSGQLCVRYMNNLDVSVAWPGTGPGGSITYITFDPLVPHNILVSSVDGTVRRHNYADRTYLEFLSTNNRNAWYCSVNATVENKLVIAGDTAGTMTLLSKDLKVVAKHKVHKGKINSLEFPKNNGWLLASASMDHTVKIWDIRKMDSESPLHILNHDNPINNANFSKVDGVRLLASDQRKQIFVYRAPLYNLETIINHPHRQFQHLTPIKASWHPKCDMIVIGRYPDPSFEDYIEGEARTLDLISAETGLIRCQLDSISCGGIMSLNVFNSTGEILASAMGRYVNYWKAKDPIEREKKKRGDSDDDDDNDKLPFPKRPRQPRSKMHAPEKTKQL